MSPRITAGVGRIAGALAIGLAVTSAPPPASAHPGIPSTVFDRAEVAWGSLRDHTPASFDAELADYLAGGYLAVDLESDVAGGARRVGGVFQRNVDGRDSRVEMRMTASQYATIRADATADGLRQVDFEAFTEGSTRYFAAAWVEDVEGLDTRHQFDLTGDQAQALYEQLRGTHMPVDIDAYSTPSGVRFASIWVRNTESLSWTLRRSVTSAQFDEQTSALGDGYRLLGFDSLNNGGSQIYSGIWVENRNGRLKIFQRDLTEQQYENRWYRYRDEGYRLVGYERYETAAGTRYAGIWRQNSNRPTWTLRSQVTDRVNQEMNDFDVPGMSVAVIQNGQTRYLRGFGYADVDGVVWLDAEHVLRLASVSKAVAGVLTMRLADQGEIAVGNRTSSYTAGLPAQHTHTIQQLVSNRGCVGHYPDVPNSIDNRLAATRYTTARTAAMEFWSLPLVSNCTVGTTNYYSTHGYTILGAAFEGATGQSAAALVRGQITTPFGLDTLRPEDRTTGTVRRTTLYNDDNTEATPDQISWKVLGGGLESSVEDLARFGDLLIRDQIVSQARQDQMWTGTGWSYAYGWNIGTVGGRLRVTKDGNQLGARSYLLMYPDDGIVVAVLSNRDGGGHSASAVARAIGTMITDTLP
jgi:CubicO group peptidase (beta-lactamase class C family)